MTQPQRKIIGKFTENFKYTVNWEPLSHPVWMPRKPDGRWARHLFTLTSEPDILRSTQWHD